MKRIIFAGIIIALGVAKAQARTVEVSTNTLLLPPGTLCVREIDQYNGRAILTETPISADEYTNQLQQSAKDLAAKKSEIDAQVAAVQQIKAATAVINPVPDPVAETPVEEKP